MVQLVKKNSKSNSPLWINRVLQGLSHWIGYKKQFYSSHLINEGAIVSEATSLMISSMNSNQNILCEVRFSDILKNVKGNERADIVSYTDGKIDFVIEVKRFEAGKIMIDADLLKLSKVKEANKEIRCLLLLVSQNNAPFPFINDNGEADRLRYPIAGTN